MRNILAEIETRYPVDQILIDGWQAWPYLRIHYFARHEASTRAESEERQSYMSPLARRIRMLASVPYGSRNWFGRYNYLCLSSAGYRRLVDGQWFDRFIDPIIDEIGPDSVLLVESPAPGHHPDSQMHTKRCVSKAALALTSWACARTVFRPVAIENMAILQAIQDETGLRVPDAAVAADFKASHRVYTHLLRRFKPRALFLTCYYGREATIKAAHDLGIRVIEVQHGVMGNEHPAYNVSADLDRSCFPDDLLVFGESERDTFSGGRFIDPTHVHPVGSFYIEYTKNNFKPAPDMVERLGRYRLTVGVTLQLGLERRVMDFVCSAAEKDRSVLYLVVPRRADNYLSGLSLPENVTMVYDHDFYELMMYVDFHSTSYSTCALEAPSMGAQNILLNIDSLAQQYFGAVLTDSRITRFVDGPEDYVEALRSFPRLDREAVCQLNTHIIAPNYRRNIRSFIGNYLKG